MGEGENIINSERIVSNPEKQISFTYTKEKLDPIKWNDTSIKGFQYRFKFPENPERQQGEAQVIFRNLEFFGEATGDKLFTVLTERGIKPTDIIAHINEFYPNGRGPKEKIEENYAKRGFGSGILDFITQEAVENKACVLFVFTRKLEEGEMADFIKKRGFEPVDKENPKNMKFFKILGQKQ